ncbi:family 78 glycoside hydrolase catalytic domain [Paradesertivirga mongoliensis]|uniref:alpha-L-rhamnosidase n=1 Tax=Paradesertivirga mongoliensis TaxID=2100740 RepID=A0ABW4ZP08_9SPHI|nr:family 78 glycoside hydrolase catalytic domain [Pedobacter mongoliensis]
MRHFIIVLLSLFTVAQASSQDLRIYDARCESKVNPLGVDMLRPRLSWKLSSLERNTVQTAYRVLVSDNALTLRKNLGNIWDSQKVNSSASIQIDFKGKALRPAQTYYWKVMVWDNKKRQSQWSPTSTFQMGLFTAADWKGAKWIAYEKLPDSLVHSLVTDKKPDKISTNNVLPLLRKTFVVDKKIKKASAFISGLGHFELSLNGKKVGDHFLDAGWTRYDKEALYVTFDITNQLKSGNNTLGVMLGNGFHYVPPVKGRFRKLKSSFGYPKMITRVLIEYTDGSSQNIISDSSWKSDKSPIIFSSIYGGEDYNANLEQKGWDTPAFNDRGWKRVLLVNGPPKLISQMAEPLRVFDHFNPLKTTKLSNGNLVYDLGQNASGIIELQVSGKKGDTVRIAPAELVKEDGSVNQKPTGSPFYFTYILKGDEVETWRPRFTYYGFRHLEVRGGAQPHDLNPEDRPKIISIKGLHTRNAAPRVGQFVSSNEIFNKTDELIDWAIKSNMASVFTDCPHREKLGWQEEVHLMGASMRYNYDISNLGRKNIQDMKTSQLPSGLVPETAPEYVMFTWGGDMFRDSPEWGSNSIIFPWYMYQWYGDKQALVSSYPMMQKYIAYLQTKANNNILAQGLGDWYDLGPKPPGVSQLTPMGVTGTAIYYYDLNIMDSIARLMGKPEDAAKYRKLAADVKKSFNQTFFNKETKQYATGSQTANAMAIFMNLVEPEYKEAVLANLIKDIRDRGNALTAGDIGFRYLLRVLENEGRSDVIYDMNSRGDVPGYGYQLAKGATALTESWAALPTVSNNHLMLGHLMEWFYSGLGGIRATEGAIAFKNIDIKPEIVGDVTFANTSYDSPYGMIKSEWRNTADGFELDVQIPANTTATVYLPAQQSSRIKEGVADLAKLNSANLKQIGYKEGRAIIKVGSGNYRFTVLNK